MVAISQLKSLPHVNPSLVLGGRTFPLLPYFDERRKWHMWLPKDNRVIEIHGHPVEGLYFAHSAAGISDLRLYYFEFLYQNALWPGIESIGYAVLSDLLNVGASLRKLRLIYRRQSDAKAASVRMAASELEYMFMICRSVYDLLQSTIIKLWHRVEVVKELQPKSALPESFRRMVLLNEKKLDAPSIASRYKLPVALAEVYAQHAEFFIWLRQYRDAIAHGGRSFRLVFRTERGFAISTKEPPFSSMDIWCASNTDPNSLGSLRAVACHLCRSTFEALDTISYIFAQLIKWPEAVAPSCGVFVRGATTRELLLARDGVKEASWYN